MGEMRDQGLGIRDSESRLRLRNRCSHHTTQCLPPPPPKSPNSARKSAATTGNTTSRRPRRFPIPQYDRLVERLKKLEAEHPELVTPDSPTQRIGDQPVEGLTPFEHRVPMLSIENTYSLDELKKYGDRVAKLLPGETVEWVVELKVDGVAVSLIYEDGLLTHGVTRGNGRMGDDITHNVRTIKDIPLAVGNFRSPLPPGEG